MKEWIKKNLQGITLVILFLNLGGGILLPVIKNIGSPDKIMNTLTRIEIVLNRDSLALLTLEMEMAGVRTAEEVDWKVQEWEEKQFIVQLAALKSVASNELDKNKLQERVFSDEVFKALMAHAL